AAVGAISSSEQEARQAQQPISWLLVLSFVSMFGMLSDPASAFAVTLSLVPFSSPIAMPVRWAAGNLPTYELALSLGILGVSIVAVTWIAARIYRVGILMTGKRPNLRELVRWVRARSEERRVGKEGGGGGGGGGGRETCVGGVVG